MAKPWQQSLLSSGLPLENDLRAYLDSKRCITNFEYSYLKPDELTIEREFSYDIDASYIRGTHFIDLMVECKYRHPGTRWVFTPDVFGGPGELHENDFMHALDHFVPQKFAYAGRFPRKLAPACSKAVELLSDGTNEKTIAQALSQLAYGFAPKVASAVEHQINKWLVADHIFYNVPIVATTADLYRLNEGVRIQHIRDANDLDQVATREPLLLMNYTAGVELQRYNATVFNSLLARVGESKLKRAMKSFTKDLGHLLSVLSNTYCPRAVVFVTVDPAQAGFEALFHYIDDLISPSADLLAELEKQEKELAALVESFPKELLRKARARAKKSDV